jgi:toxin CcdB
MLSQFDVHRFLGRAHATVPYLLIVQSNAFRPLDRRLALPLVSRDALPSEIGTLFPEFRIEGTPVVAAALDLASYPKRAFGELVTSLAEEGDAIIAAIDIVISRAFS